MRVGVVGAGATGLAAAFELGKHGHSVSVFEHAPFLGGHASTFDVGDARLERGYHHLFTSDTDIVDLIHEIGLGGKLRWIESRVGTLYGGRIYPFVTPLDLLRFKPLPLLDRFRLGLIAAYLQRRRDYTRYEGVTAAEWLRRYAGKRSYNVFWGPMLRGKFGEDHYEQVGMTWVWGKLHTRFASRDGMMARERLGYPMGSFGEVFDVLAERVRAQGGAVRVSSPVRRIVTDEGRVTSIEWSAGGAESAKSEVLDVDAVIATTPSHIFHRLVPPLPDDYMAKLTDVTYMAAVLVILVLDRPLSDVYWLNVADRSIPFVGVIEQTNFVEPEHYGGKHVVYLSNYLRTDHPLYRMDHQELLQEYLPHLRKINPAFDPSWIETSYHHRIDGAQPIIGTNYSSRMPAHRTPIKGVYLANTTQIYPEDRGTNYSVRMGKMVARMLMADLGTTAL